MNIYVYNLSSSINENSLRQLFSVYGEVNGARIVNDVISGESRGYGYVEMDDEVAAIKAINGLNNTEHDTLVISVEEVKSKIIEEVSDRITNRPANMFRFTKN